MPALTRRPAVELADAIRRREVTATQVVDAHIEILERTGPRIGAIAAERFDQARAQARTLDQRIAGAALRGAAVEDLAPLAGVPFTVMESIALEGMPHSAGLLARRDRRASQSASAVKRLLEAGAIPLGVTNTSELTLSAESENPVYGRTSNPRDETRTAGGSAGGQAAAVAVGGSAFGIGSDVGGSIRLSALFCGVFGHKPSAGLVPTTGTWPTPRGDGAGLISVGPIAHHAADLLPLLALMAGPDGRDGHASPMSLGDIESVSLDGLLVTLVEDASPWPISTEMRDARSQAAGALASAGARVRSASLRSWRGALLPYLAALDDGDAGQRRVRSLLRESGEPETGLLRLLLGGGEHTLPTRLALLAEVVPVSASTRKKLQDRARALADELRETIGGGVLLHAAYPSPAPRHRRTYGRPWLMAPTAVFNLAGVPVTEVPMGLSAAGLPLGVQVAAPHGADHLSIAVALELEAVFGGWAPPEQPQGEAS